MKKKYVLIIVDLNTQLVYQHDCNEEELEDRLEKEIDHSNCLVKTEETVFNDNKMNFHVAGFSGDGQRGYLVICIEE